MRTLTSLRKPLVLSGFISVVACLSACSTYKVDEINYGSHQHRATILVSDPQLYSRASLINDRRSETEYLQQLLDNSKVDSNGHSEVNFAPQLLRDVRTVQALSASLGLTIGKAEGTSISALQRQVEVEQLKGQLVTLQKQVAGIEAAAPPKVPVPAPDLGSTTMSPSQQAQSQNVMTPDVSALQSSIKDMQSQLSSLESVSGPTAPSNSYSGLTDPRDDFIDRQAYRRDIRAALAENQLDDTHDADGNTLYRMQFEITTLPRGAHFKQWGVVRMRISPPRLSASEIRHLYYGWLSYLSQKMSNSVTDAQSAHDKGSISTRYDYDFDFYLERIGRRILNVIDVYQSAGRDYCVNHWTATAAQLLAIDKHPEGKIDIPNPNGTGPEQIAYKLGTLAVPPNKFACESYTSAGVPKLTAVIPRKSFYYWLGSVTPPRRAQLLSAALTADFHTLAETMKIIQSKESTSQEVLNAVRRRQPALTEFDARLKNYVPSAFCAEIVGPSNCRSGVGVDAVAAASDSGATDDAIRSYSIMPAELVQRLGVTTEASQSLQTALAIAAQASAATTTTGELGYLRQSDARAEALDRQPLVVGFASSFDTGSGAEEKKPYFGWIFGPKYDVQYAHKLSLAQPVANYGVDADVSIPGWWPSFTLHIATVWIGNWRSDELMESTHIGRMQKTVTLPLSGLTYDSLTDYLAARAGAEDSAIFASYVTPNVLPACRSTVTLQIGGSNIWRADIALLGGTPAKKITVLPNMKGIVAEFDMSAVYGSLANTASAVQKIPLLVSDEYGAANALPVYVVGGRQASNGAAKCQSPILAPTDLNTVEPTVVASLPAQICTDTTSFSLLVEGLGLHNGLTVAPGGLFSSVQPSSGDRTRQVVNIMRQRNPSNKMTPRSVTLVLESESESKRRVELAVPLNIVNCSTAGAASHATKHP